MVPIARLSLTATTLPGTGSSAPLSLTAAVAANSIGSNTGVSFSWNPQYFLAIGVSATTTTTFTVNIGTTIEGEPVTSITTGSVTGATTTGSIELIGPFPQDEETSAGIVTVDFGTSASVSGVALIQF